MHLLLPEPIRLRQALLDFALHVEGDFQGQRGDAAHQQMANGLVNAASGYSLTGRLALFHAVLLTEVIGREPPEAVVVSDGHGAAALAADHQPLQQCRAFARRPRLALSAAVGLVVLEQPLAMAQELLPSHIAGMSVLFDKAPLVNG